jgi:hypothetical protein
MNLYPSVTQVLKTYHNSIAVPDSVMARAMVRGTAVHEYCASIANGIPAIGVPEDYREYVENFQNWFDTFADETLFTEVRLVDDALGFHGQPDIVVKVKDESKILIDLKTGVFGMKLWPLQLSAYKHLLELIDIHVDRTAVLLLNQEPAKLIEYKTTAKNLNIFFQMLNIFRFLDLERSE